jgi:hypothetical protein
MDTEVAEACSHAQQILPAFSANGGHDANSRNDRPPAPLQQPGMHASALA